ncbi:MAG: PDZ domain-containing protein [Gammaproteobacteria bacterium]|nr:PDZ domain-containing protein [Gammaproteobacteria bacterium]
MTHQFEVQYTIKPSRPEAHIYQVSCYIKNPDPEGQIVYMPAWIPGSYMIRDFAKNIVQIKAMSDGKPIKFEKRDKQTWQCAPCSEALTLEYEVYAWDLSVRTAHLDTSHAYYNGSSVFLAVKGKEWESCGVEIQSPDGNQYKDWRVATCLSRAEAELYGFGTYTAGNYEELIDHPVEMANFTLASFEAGGILHDIVITGKHRADMDRLCQDLQAICQSHIDLFGELPDMQRYLFLVMVVGSGYGGLEHRSSTSLLCSRNNLPLANQTELTDDYVAFLGLCSHEYFHTWNIKQIKPEAFLPYNLQQESYTKQLWAFEGFTSYFDDLALVRTGLIKPQRYLELLGQTATRVWHGSGRLKQSAAESSFDAWTKFYKQDENAPNAIVSYYTRGALLALSVDCLIRQHTNDNKSLDDVMRHLWQEYGKPQKGVPEARIEEIISTFAGVELSEFFNKHLHGTEDIPLPELLNHVGVNFLLRPAENMDDKGGKPASSNQPVSGMGARFVKHELGALLTHVFDNGPAQRAGLSAGDVIIAIDQLKTDKANIDKTLASYTPGSTIFVHAFRRDELMELSVTLAVSEENTCVITLDDKATNEQYQARNTWLRYPYSEDTANNKVQLVK